MLRWLFTLMVVLLCTIGNSSGQYIRYHNACNAAVMLMEDGIYDLARDSLRTAIRSVDRPLPIDQFNLAKCYSQLGLRDSTLLYLMPALEGDPRIQTVLKSHHLYFDHVLGWDTLMELLEREFTTPLPESTPVEEAIIQSLQQYRVTEFIIRRTFFDSVMVHHKDDTVLVDDFRDSVDLHYATMAQHLDSIMEVCDCFPGYRVLHRSNVAAYMLWRLPDEWLIEREARFIQEIDRGNMMPWDLSPVRNKMLVYQGQEPIFKGYNKYDHQPSDALQADARRFGAPIGPAFQIRRAFTFR